MTTPLGTWTVLTDNAGSSITGTLTPETGTDRVAVLIASMKTDSSYIVGTKPVFSLSGGHTVAVGDTYVSTVGSTNAGRRLAMAVIRDADIPASAETLTVTIDNSSGVYSAAYRFFEDVAQSGTVREADSDAIANSADQTLTLATLENGDHIIAAGTNADAGAVTLAGYTSLDKFGTERTDVFEKAVTTTAAEDLVFSFTGGSRSGTVALALVPATAPGGGGGGTTTIIQDSNVIYETTVENLQSQTSFGLAVGPTSDTQMLGNVLVISKTGNDHDFCKFKITSYDATGGTAARLVGGAKDASGYTIADTDRVRVYAAYEGVNVIEINESPVLGTGTVTDLWRGA